MQKISNSHVLPVQLLIGFVFLEFGIFIPINYLVVQAADAGMSSNLA